VDGRVLHVRDLMTRDVVTLERNDRLIMADDVMRLGRIRHLPIVDSDGALAGIVSQRDLFHSGLMKALGYGSRGQRKALEMVLIKEAMRTEVVTTTPDTKLCDAARLMLERKIGCLVVVEGDKIVGILSESDFVKLHLEDEPG
jgi:CBS domain-containing membrane protein